MRPTPLSTRRVGLSTIRPHPPHWPAGRTPPIARAGPPEEGESNADADAGGAAPGDGDWAARPPDDGDWAARLASGVRSVFDFESWAPKSSRVWRLQKAPKGFESAQAAQAAADAAFVDGLNAALSAPGAASARADARASVSSSEDEDDDGEGGSGTDDAALAASLAARLAAGAPSPSSSASTPPPLASADEEEAAAAVAAAAAASAAPPLSGQELAALVLSKYGLPYDLTIVRRNLAGIRVVALNVMWQYLGQRSLTLSPEAYADKCDALAAALTAWGCAGAVRAFFTEPPRSKRGLPGRPVVGNAVSLRLDVDPDVVAEWMGGT